MDFQSRARFARGSPIGSQLCLENVLRFIVQVDVKRLLTNAERKIFIGTKRPITGYALYVKQTYPKFKEMYPSNSEAISALASNWKSMEEKQKQKYKFQAEEVRVRSNLVESF